MGDHGSKGKSAHWGGDGGMGVTRSTATTVRYGPARGFLLAEAHRIVSIRLCCLWHAPTLSQRFRQQVISDRIPALGSVLALDAKHLTISKEWCEK